MNLPELQRKLIAAARSNTPGDQVPYAFEKRISALLASRVAPHGLDWVRGLWRAAVFCMAIALVSGTWAFFMPAKQAGVEDLSQNFETTLLASVDQTDQAQ